MAKPWKDPKSGIYHVYRWVPVRIKSEYPKASVKRSLGTRDPAEAARRYPEANAKVQREFDEVLERVLRQELSPPRADEIVRRFLAERVRPGSDRYPTLVETWWLEDTADRTLETGAPGTAPPDHAREDVAEQLVARRGLVLTGERWLAAVMRHPRSRWMPAASLLLDKLFAAAGPSVPRTPANVATVMDAWNALVREDVERYRQDVEAPFNEAARPRERPDLRLRQLLAAWQADRAPSAQYVREATTAVDDLISYAGDVPVAAITSTMLMNYRDEARKLPAAMPRADRLLPFKQRVDRHADTGAPRVTATTLKKRIGAIQALLSHAFNEKMVAANAGLGIRITGYARARGGKRRAFLDDELKALFESPLFLRPDLILRRRTAVGDPTLYWLFVLGCTSGARLEEVGQVRLADVRIDGGVRYVDITDVEPVETAGGHEEKKIKTEQSDRYVPVHPIALRLGFERYLAALSRHGATLLFPDLFEANELGKVTQEASRLLNRYVDRHVTTDARLVWYSLRHKFKDEGTDADVPEKILDQLCGHAPVSVGRRYGSGAKLQTLMRHLEKLRFAMVDWDALERAAALIDWDKVVAETMRRVRTATSGEAR